MKCPSCGYENEEGARYCNLCQNSFVGGPSVREPSAPYGLDPLAEPSQEAVKAVKQVLRSQPKGENWFQRHLNLTWVFAQIAVGMIAYFLITVLVSSLFISSTMPSETSFLASISVIQIVVLVLQIASVFGIGAWVLKRKERSLGWLLIFLVPFGWIVFLCLGNHSFGVDVPVSSGPSGPYGSSGASGSSSSIPPGLAPYGLGSRSDKYGP